MVFLSEQELKQHNARDHAGSMSRAERRQALTIPIDIQVPPPPPRLPLLPAATLAASRPVHNPSS